MFQEKRLSHNMKGFGDILVRRTKKAFSSMSSRNRTTPHDVHTLDMIPALRRTSSSTEVDMHSSHIPSPYEKVSNGKGEVFPPTSAFGVAPNCPIETGRPIHSLPRHVLELIFHETRVNGDCSPPSRPPLISQVCRSWREIGLSLPCLWSAIYLDLRCKSSRTTSYLILLHSILQRSRSALLQVHIVIPHGNPRAAYPAFDVLASHSNRWKSATIEFPPSGTSILHKLRGHLGSLQSLDLVASESNETTSVTHDMFAFAPELRHVRIRGNWRPTTFLLPWYQITYYEDESGVSEATGSFLRSLSSITEIVTTWPTPISDPYPFDKAPICLKDLRTLHIAFVFLSHSGLFDKLLLPNIRDIKITSHPGNPYPAVASMLSRSTAICHLQSFTCHTEFRRSEDLIDFLRLVPQLQHLNICLPPIEDLYDMLIQPFALPLVPNLQTLRFVTDSIRNHIPNIRLLAENRCNWEDHAPLHSDPCTHARTLKSFEIEFKESQIHHVDREYLEDSFVNASNNDRAAQVYLRPWKYHLMELMPWIFESTLGPKRCLLKKQLQALDYTFNLIESFELQDVKHLYMSGLHHALHLIKTHPSSHIPGNKKYRFQDRANQILDNWTPFLVADLRNRRWALSGHHLLIYVPRSEGTHDRNMTLEQLNINIYGL